MVKHLCSRYLRSIWGFNESQEARAKIQEISNIERNKKEKLSTDDNNKPFLILDSWF